MILKYKFLIFSIVFCLVNVIYCARGGGGGRSGGGSRGGGFFGGGSRSGSGSSFGNTGSRIGTSRFSSGTRAWTGVASGLLAYSIMSRIASNRPYYHGSGYYYRTTPRKSLGSYCVNEEDFNGTVLGRFQCPIDGFGNDDKYCCGDSPYQYCCGYFDDTGRLVGVIFAIICVLGFIICCVACCIKMRSKIPSPKNMFKGPSFRNINRRPPQPMNPTQMYPRPPPMHNPATPFIPPQPQNFGQPRFHAPYPPSTVTVRAQINNNGNQLAPYPKGNMAMPQPTVTYNAPLSTQDECSPYPPPAYREVVNNPQASAPPPPDADINNNSNTK